MALRQRIFQFHQSSWAAQRQCHVQSLTVTESAVFFKGSHSKPLQDPNEFSSPTASVTATTKTPQIKPWSPLLDKQLAFRMETEWKSCVNAPKITEIIESRRHHQQDLEQHPVIATRVAGVTFDNRQEVLKELRPYTPVVLEPEPTNAYDPCAIKIALLNGTMLGYVPKEETHYFPKDKVIFGRVQSVGQSSVGTLGAFVHTQPKLNFVHLDIIPISLWGSKALWKYLTPLRRSKLLADFVQGDRCSLTRAGKNVELCTVGSWSVDRSNKTLELVGFKSTCSVLASIVEKPLATWSTVDVALLALVNRWSLLEANSYYKICKVHSEELNCEADDWSLNLNWLKEKGGRIPKKYKDTWAVKD